MADGPADLRHLHRVGQPRAVEIVFARQEHLRLGLQLAEGMRMDDAVAVDLERAAVVRLAARAPHLDVEGVVEAILHGNRFDTKANPHTMQTHMHPNPASSSLVSKIPA